MSVEKLVSKHPQIVESLKSENITDFRKFQEQAIEVGLLTGKNLLITTPTGSGKTLIGELAILNNLLRNEDKKALFLVPLKAVASEKYEEFSRKYGQLFNVKVATGDYEAIPEEITEANLIIATYERFDSLLRTRPEWLPDIAVIIIDEVHMIGQKERGSRLESVIIRLKEYLPYTQLICLSATVKNSEELSSWLDAFPIISDERPVPLLVKIIVSPNKFSSITELIEKTVRINGQVLVFVMTRRDSEFLAERIANQLAPILKPKNQEVDVSQISGLSIKLKTVIQKGVGYHHAGLIANDRKIVEKYFKQGLIKVIVCTTTLSAGINVPARLVIIKDTEITRKEIVLRKLNSNEIFQILGRAGRPGLDEEGIGIILTDNKEDKQYLEASLYHKISDSEKIERYEPVLSQFDEISTLREQVLVKVYEKKDEGLSEEQLISFFKRTFWAYLERKKGKNPLPKYSGRSIREILSDVELIELFERGKLLLTDVQLLDISKDRLLGRVGNYIVSFDENKGHYCNCDIKNSQRICPHRIAFALYCDEYKELDAYTKTIVRNALEKDIFTYLNQADLIKIRDGKYFVTNFGRAAVLHYIRPETSQIIRDVLLNTSEYTTENVLLLSAKLLTKEFSIKYTATELFNCLSDWINENDINEVLRIIEPGDFESIRSSINWILNAILGIGRSMGDIERSLEPIVKSLIERIRVGVKEELVKISPFFEYTDRKKLRRLYLLGIRTVADLINKKEVL